MPNPVESDSDGTWPSLSVIVVTHNSARHLPAFLKSWRQDNYPGSSELIVVDNASVDQTVDVIKTLTPDARLIRNDTNRGFAAAVNQGAALAQGSLLLIANPDVTWKVPVLSALIQQLTSQPRVAAISPRLVFPDGSDQPAIRRFPTHSNIWFSRGSPLGSRVANPNSRFTYTVSYPTEPSRVEAAAATFLLMRKDAFLSISGMDERYYLYVEDTDLCKRWSDSGHEVWIAPNVVVTHDWQGGSTRSPALSKLHRAGICQYFKIHHARKRLRNGFLFLVLRIADWSQRDSRGEQAT